LGGTFDPVHNAHLAIAEETRRRLQLPEVVFVPAGQPWMKEGVALSPANQRLEMLHLALADKPYFEISTVDIDRDGPSYTVDTINDLHVEYGDDTEFYFIMGWDSLVGFPRWKTPGRLIEICRLVVLPRPGFPHPDMIVLEKQVPGITSRTIFLERPEMDVSATTIRERIAKGEPLSDLLPPGVERYIKEKGLYHF